MKLVIGIFVMALFSTVSLALAGEVFEAIADEGANAIWIVDKDTGQVKMCRSANNNTVILCSPWSAK